MKRKGSSSTLHGNFGSHSYTERRKGFGNIQVVRSPDSYKFSLDSVTFNPDWEYMAVATVESLAVFELGDSLLSRGKQWSEHISGSLLPFDTAQKKIFSTVPWISSVWFDGKICDGLVDNTQFLSFHGSRCLIAFDEHGTALHTRRGVYEITTGKYTSFLRYLNSLVLHNPNNTVRQITFGADDRKVANVRDRKVLSSGRYGWISSLHEVSRGVSR